MQLRFIVRGIGHRAATSWPSSTATLFAGTPPRTSLLAGNLNRSFESFMDPTVRELPKDEEIVLPDIRFLTQDELDALRANAEELKKKFDQLTR
jgi:hypothetical protein